MWKWNIGLQNANLNSENRAHVSDSKMLILASVKPIKWCKDTFIWWRDSSGFLVKNSYKPLSDQNREYDVYDDLRLGSFCKVWKMKLSSKV